ncbi:35744_t:CDS:1, partial [Racocetra persica]
TKVIEYLAIEAQFRIGKHYDFYIIAGQILAKHQLEHISQIFSEHVMLLYDNFHKVTNEIKEHIPLIDKRYHDIVIKNKEFFDSLIDFTREYDHGYMEYVRN